MNLPSRPIGAHPPPEDIFAARRDPTSETARRTFDHVATCATCSEVEDSLEAFENPDPASKSRRLLDREWNRFGTASERPRLRFAYTWAVAAAVLLAAGAVLVSSNRREDSERGHARSTAAAPVSLVAPPESFPVNLLEKTPARVIVFSGDRAYRWTSEPTSAASIPFPKEERAKLKPGVVYYWAFVDSEEPAKAFVLK